MTRTVLVRRSSLGDVILAASVTGALGDVIFVTSPRYHELVRRFPGVTEVRAPGDPLPAGVRVVRCMPNTPALVGKGAAAFCRGKAATDADAGAARLLLGSVGIAVELPESLMDAVTGLSGSGPAFVYIMIEAMADGGVRAGLPRVEIIHGISGGRLRAAVRRYLAGMPAVTCAAPDDRNPGVTIVYF